MIGYKAFDKDLKCRGFQFEIGKTYRTGVKKDKLELCSDTVFHFCRELYCIEKESNYKLSESRICEVIATDAEKEQHKKEIEVMGGFLKEIDYKEAFKLSYKKASKEDREKLFNLPNFDPAIFKEISGIDTTKEYNKYKRAL